MKKQMEGFSLYDILEDGRVWSYLSNKYLVTKKSNSDPKRNYWKIRLTADDGKTKSFYIHRLVAMLFVNNPNNLQQVDHLDGDHNNNHYTNLEWVTNGENQRRAWKNGLNKGNTGTKYSDESKKKISDGLKKAAITKRNHLIQKLKEQKD